MLSPFILLTKAIFTINLLVVVDFKQAVACRLKIESNHSEKRENF